MTINHQNAQESFHNKMPLKGKEKIKSDSKNCKYTSIICKSTYKWRCGLSNLLYSRCPLAIPQVWSINSLKLYSTHASNTTQTCRHRF